MLFKIFVINIFLLSLAYSQSQTTLTSTRTTVEATTTVTVSPIFCQNIYGFNKLNGTCSLIENCVGGAFSSNCPKPQICCVPDATLNLKENVIITKKIFLKIVGNTFRNDWLYNYFVESMELASIDNQYKAAAYLSQLIGETDYFKSIESVKPEKDIDESIGNNKTGDGSNYRGRGGILLRGKNNYDLANKSLQIDIVSKPEQAVFPSIAFKLASWFWLENAYVVKSLDIGQKETLNNLVDGTFFNYSMLTHSLTSNLQSLKSRAIVNDLILNELNYGVLKRGQGVQCSFKDESNETGYAVPICLADFKKSYCGCEGQYEVSTCPYGFNFQGKCRNSALIKCCIEKCTANLDLVILTDSSGSIGTENFQKIRDFLTELIKNLPIGNNETKVSIINYSSSYSILIDFNAITSQEILLDKIKKMPYRTGGTNTAGALKAANEKVLTESTGMRPITEGVPKVVMVITDGESDNKTETLKEADKLKTLGFNLISVGVGKASLPELIGIASSPQDQYYVSDFNSILRIITELSKTTCQQPADIPTKTEIKAVVPKNSYKYFKMSLFESNKTNVSRTSNILKEITFELKQLAGSTELFYSFEDENPKSDTDYYKDENPTESDSNLIDKKTRITKRYVKSIKKDTYSKAAKNSDAKLYPIRQSGNLSDIIYFSVKGFDENNEFQVYVYEEYKKDKSSILGVVLGVVFGLIAVALIGIAGYFSIKKLYSNSKEKRKSVYYN